jgi:phosphatidylglycerophosphate synthase
VDGVPQRLLFLAAAGGIQLRLLANMLDGMVALASGTASPTGELYNEIPDRVSDTLILVGAGYAAGGLPALGWAAACMALFVTYIRAVGKTLGVQGLYHGPMSKSHRMFTLTVACVFLGAAPAGWHAVWNWRGQNWGVMGMTLGIIIVGSGVTAARRLSRISA